MERHWSYLPYTINAPSANRPIMHWDITVSETLNCAECTPKSYDFSYHVGNSFWDVPVSNLFYKSVETIMHAEITGGCSPNLYCPLQNVTREQMAKFICAAIEKKKTSACTTAACSNIFADVPNGNIFCSYIEALYTNGIVSGCNTSPLLYCPLNNTLRQEMAKFICNTMEAANVDYCTETTCDEIFADVPTSNPFCPDIESLYYNNIVSGCSNSPMLYCPNNAVSREQMAKFLVLALEFSL
ncbi:MAG: hypothetical protein A2Y62_02150 [Candidatus Fischerbacteria bacterium RBG_13_37_8]|uniref:SLH domain-containing protein n=1 Tax=Candidatus Fischerbacteria bacterium RBG_13_37_8 TaxID=1817863 RepID=A0A1F5VK04_9BACT|nr:MAG: hypothetical protein A2Y62_02150 [Candidatus Fischerbacteria bacterium RBG_13_37_8]